MLKRHRLDVRLDLRLERLDARRREGIRFERVLLSAVLYEGRPAGYYLTHSEILETVDEEDVAVPRAVRAALLAQVGHALTHLDGGVDGRVEELGKVRLALARVDERGIVHSDDFAQDLADVPQRQGWGEGGVGRVEEAEEGAALRLECLEERCVGVVVESASLVSSEH